MFFFNLSLGEFLALLSGTSATVVLLYLLDRSKQRLKVSTLRFWTPALEPAVERQRKRIQQPWSMLLQLISLLLLLLAIAQLRWGSPDEAARDHVLVMDTSAWMAARAGDSTYADQARANAKAWLKSLPTPDRVMLVRADSTAIPVTAFESKRGVIERAIDESRPGPSALRLESAMRLVDAIQRQHARARGEIVYAGAARVAGGEPTTWTGTPTNWRWLPVRGKVENAGIRRIGVRRAPNDPAQWQVFVSVRNYGMAPRRVPLEVRFGGAAWATRQLTIPPGGEQETSFEYRSKAGGLLEARLIGRDALSEDDRAILELPGERRLSVTVYTNDAESLRPVLGANARIDARYRRPQEFTPAEPGEVLIFDRVTPPNDLKSRAILIAAPGMGRPVSGAKLKRWRDDTAIGAGLRTQDLVFDAAMVLNLKPGAITVAEVDAGPVIVAEPGPPQRVLMGFQPLQTSMRFELATPLLFANVLKWLAPESFERWELNAGSPGTILANVDAAAPVEVRADQQTLPFTRDGGQVRFFMGAAGTVRVTDGQREIVYSLTLPEIAESDWTWPAGIRRGVPAASAWVANWRELWPWLAIGGAIGLLFEWLLFGLGRRALPPLFFRKRADEPAAWRVRRAS